MKRMAGGIVLLMGLLLGLWLFYNWFIHPLPEARGRPVLPPLLVCAGFLFVGVKWLREPKRAEDFGRDHKYL